MAQKRIGIIMNGVTGRMGYNQHLVRSILAIREQGGVKLSDGTFLYPDPILVGRNPDKIAKLAKDIGITRYTTDLDAALRNADDPIYFDAQVTSQRAACVKKAIVAKKHIYCEKPIAVSSEEALELAKLARAAGVKNGVVQDKLFLPGIRKLKRLIDSGFFGKLLSVRGEFGYWVFEGDWQPSQRPSWNYRKEDDGGIIVDMFCHWRYVLDHTFGKVKAVNCLAGTAIPERVDEQGKIYKCTADDYAYGTFEIEGGVVAQINSSWATRVYRDELFTMLVDGTHGSAVAGLRECKAQHRVNTPKAIWNPDVKNPIDFFEAWEDVPDNENFENAFKVQWELFLKHVVEDMPFPHDFLEGARGVQLAELGLASWEKRAWLDVPELSV
jgi:predicted dehydrogenase